MCGVADSPGGTEQRPDHKILVFYENLWTFEILVMERCSTTYKKKRSLQASYGSMSL